MRKLSRVTEIRRVLRQVQPDFVVPFVDNLIYAAFLASRGLPVAYISAVRNHPSIRSAVRAERLISRIVNLFADAVFLQTWDQASFYSRRIQSKAFVVPNPVSDAFAVAPPVLIERVERIVTLGRLVHQKNHRLLIAAFAKAHARYPSLQLTIYGEGKMREDLHAQAITCGVADAVHLPGRRDDAVNVLRENDLFVLSSDYEGFPNALIEAMCVGLPCISTNCPTGPGELLKDDRGILTPPGDEGELSNAIIRMVEQPQEAAAMGARARAYVLENYAERAIAEQFAAKCMRHQRLSHTKEQRNGVHS